MTRGSKNAKAGVDKSEAIGRLRKAKAYHAMAKDGLAILDAQGLDRSPAISNSVLAVIAYVDAVTIIADGRKNQKDHASASALLRDCIGKDLPQGRLNDLNALLSTKDEVQYGSKITLSEASAKALEQLDRFASWATEWLAQKGVT